MKAKLLGILVLFVVGFIFGLSTGVTGYGLGINGGFIFACLGGLLGYVVVDLVQKNAVRKKNSLTGSK